MLYEFRGVDLADKEAWSDYVEVYTQRDLSRYAEGLDDYASVMPDFVQKAPEQAKEFLDYLHENQELPARTLACYLSPGLIGVDGDKAAQIMSGSLRDPEVRPTIMDFMETLVEGGEGSSTVLGQLNLRQLATVIRAYKIAQAGEGDQPAKT